MPDCMNTILMMQEYERIIAGFIDGTVELTIEDEVVAKRIAAVLED